MKRPMRWIAGPPPLPGRLGRGHSLLELMIALVLGVAVTSLACALYRPMRDAFDAAGDRAEIDEAGHAALTLIAQRARLAGLSVRADGSAPARAQWSAVHGPVFGCEAGRPDGAIDAPHCEPDAGSGGPGGNGGASEPGAVSDGVQFLALASSVAEWANSKGAPTDCLGQALAPGMPDVARFYAHPGGGDDGPELYCEGGGRLGDPQPVVSGVETLRLRYWLDGAATPQRRFDANRVHSLRALVICVVVRGAATHRRYPYRDCDGQSQPGNDGYRRRRFQRLIALRNLAGVS
jgi:type IV pilus assembly protein PilW